MAKSKTSPSKASVETLIEELTIAPESPIALEPINPPSEPPEQVAIKFGWVLSGGDGRFVDHDGFWVVDVNNALFFDTGRQASEHNANWCEGLYQVVAINV